MFSTNPVTKLYADGDMEAMIKRQSTKKRNSGSRRGQLTFGEPLDQPIAAIQRMRTVVGAYLYLKEQKVNQIFINQVNRIGTQLENIEKQLAKTPRTALRKYDDPKGGNVKIERKVTFDAWKHQKLKEKWFAYMDQVYKDANQRGQDFMKENLQRLRDEYSDKNLKRARNAVKEEKNKKRKDELSLEVQLREKMKKHIPKLRTQWTDAKKWTKPKWNA